MLTYIEYTDKSLLLEFLVEQNFSDSDHQLKNQILLDCLLSTQNIQKYTKTKFVKVNSLIQIEENLTQDDGLFDNENTKENVDIVNLQIVIDIQDIPIIEIPKILTSIDNCGYRVYFYSTTTTLVLDDKKLFKKHSIEYKELKKVNKDTATEICTKYSNDQKITIPKIEMSKLCDQALSYYEIIDNIDFISLSSDQDAAYQNLFREEKVPLFMRVFSLNSIKKDSSIWAKQVNEDELQLALSLIFTKLSKTNTQVSRDCIKELIETDQKIKTRAKINPHTWYKLLLWKMANQFS